MLDAVLRHHLTLRRPLHICPLALRTLQDHIRTLQQGSQATILPNSFQLILILLRLLLQLIYGVFVLSSPFYPCSPAYTPGSPAYSPTSPNYRYGVF